ncbi:MAG: hypothetical protein GY811_10735 [Myxococcales bacterium]|nr:hypothetical protein [Myxococcales bacterium]
MSREDTLIIFRADTRGTRGDRNLRECLILAEAHTQQGGRAQFALNQDQRTARTIVTARGLGAIAIDAPLGSEADSGQLLSAATNRGAASVVIVGQAFDRAYLSTIAASIFTAVIEDGGERVLPVQLIINSGFSADERFYTCRADTTLLLGPAYKLVTQDVAAWPMPERTTPTSIERLFVTSSDDHASARILDSLPHPSKTTIITLFGSRTCPILDAAARAACGRGYIIEQIARSTVTDALLFCDAAIVTTESLSGLIGFLGIPTLCVSHDREDAREVQRLAEEGANMHSRPLRETTNQDLQVILEDFLLDESQRRRFGKRIARLVDGRGTERILANIAQSERPRLHGLKAA